MLVRLETIHPQKAKEILTTKNNINVRKINKALVANYARQMIAGNWHFSWDCIAFDKDGNLLNGQHRLTACVKSNIPIKTFVIYDAVDITGDTGRKRSAIEELRGRGESLPDGFSDNFAIACLRDIFFTYLMMKNASSDECYELASLPGIQKALPIMKSLKNAPKGIKVAPIASAIIGAYIVTKNEKCIEFAGRLADGDIKSVDQVVISKTREKLILSIGNPTGAYGNLSKKRRLITQTGLRYYLEGKTPKNFVVSEKMIYEPTEEMFRVTW
jgi:hypothetical protein